MLIIDASGIVRYANIQVTALFGHAHDDIVGKSVDILLPERLRSRHGTNQPVSHRFGASRAGAENHSWTSRMTSR